LSTNVSSSLAPRQTLEAAHGRDEVSVGSHYELQNYFVDLESLGKDTSAVQYWLYKEPQS